MSKALDALVVLDMTSEFWSSLGVALLGDFGARAIKVERTGERETGDAHPPGSWNYHDELANRNKTSLALDWELPRGRRILDELLRQTDVLVVDRPAAQLREQGLDYETVARLKPDMPSWPPPVLHPWAFLMRHQPGGSEVGQLALEVLERPRSIEDLILSCPGREPVEEPCPRRERSDWPKLQHFIRQSPFFDRVQCQTDHPFFDRRHQRMADQRVIDLDLEEQLCKPLPGDLPPRRPQVVELPSEVLGLWGVSGFENCVTPILRIERERAGVVGGKYPIRHRGHLEHTEISLADRRLRVPDQPL